MTRLWASVGDKIQCQLLPSPEEPAQFDSDTRKDSLRETISSQYIFVNEILMVKFLAMPYIHLALARGTFWWHFDPRNLSTL